MIYLDNAATSFPKPPEVIRAAAGVMEKLGGNPGRSGHTLSLCAGRVVNRCREEAARLFAMDNPERVIFTLNCTDAINIAIRGMLHLGDEVICSHAEHNAVMRVLKGYEARGMITLTVLKPNNLGLLEPQTLQRAFSPKTSLVVLSHASNVTGIIQPINRLGAVCRENGVPLLVDAAQTAGILDTSPAALKADMVAMPGHKSLLGPQGTGLLLLNGALPRPFREGGTGSRSESMLQPEEMPDRFESGTLNLPGIAGLLQGIRFVAAHQSEIRTYEDALITRMADGLMSLPGVTVLGDPDVKRVGVLSFVLSGMDSSEAADALSQMRFAVRGGLHCAPSIHQFLGTLKTGAVRASVGIYNTEDEVDQFVDAVWRLTGKS